MKIFKIQNGPYIQNNMDQSLHYFIKILIIMIIYRLLEEGIIPYVQGVISVSKLFSIFFVVFITLVFSYICFYMEKRFFISKLKAEEFFIDGMLFYLLFSYHYPIAFIFTSIFISTIVKNHLRNRKIYINPIFVGLISSVVLFQIGLNEEWNMIINPYLCMISFLFFIHKKIIKWRITVYFIGSYFIIFIFSNCFSFMPYTISIITFCNLLFLSIFVVSDKRTTPITNGGQIMFSSFLALFTYIGSYFVTSSVALVLSTLLLNCMVPIFDYFGNYYGLKFCNEFDILQ